MHRDDPRPVDEVPSRVASERLARTLHREIAELEVRLSEAVLRSDLFREAGQPQAAANAVVEQQELLHDFHARVDAAVSSAIVEREAEQVVADALARHRKDEAPELRPPAALMAALAGLFLLAVMLVAEEPPSQLLRSSLAPAPDEPAPSQVDATPLGLQSTSAAVAEREIADADTAPSADRDGLHTDDDVGEAPTGTLEDPFALLHRDVDAVEHLLATTVELDVLDRAERTADAEEPSREQEAGTDEGAGAETDDASADDETTTGEDDDTATDGAESQENGDDQPVAGDRRGRRHPRRRFAGARARIHHPRHQVPRVRDRLTDVVGVGHVVGFGTDRPEDHLPCPVVRGSPASLPA